MPAARSESIQWNWKCLMWPDVGWCQVMGESIQWNWKKSPEQTPAPRLYRFRNPFNGIERPGICMAGLRSPIYLGIHSMELKVLHSPPPVPTVKFTENPFNGIERPWELSPRGRGSLANPFNGIESYLPKPPNLLLDCESIQWNWKNFLTTFLVYDFHI